MYDRLAQCMRIKWIAILVSSTAQRFLFSNSLLSQPGIIVQSISLNPPDWCNMIDIALWLWYPIKHPCAWIHCDNTNPFTPHYSFQSTIIYCYFFGTHDSVMWNGMCPTVNVQAELIPEFQEPQLHHTSGTPTNRIRKFMNTIYYKYSAGWLICTIFVHLAYYRIDMNLKNDSDKPKPLR